MTWSLVRAGREQALRDHTTYAVIGEQPRHTRVRKLLIYELLHGNGRRIRQDIPFDNRWRYGYELSQETGIGAGSMYPFLRQLCAARAVETKNDYTAVADSASKFRRMYILTPAGIAWARAWLDGRPLPALDAEDAQTNAKEAVYERGK